MTAPQAKTGVEVELPPLPKPKRFFGHSTMMPMWCTEEMREYAAVAISNAWRRLPEPARLGAFEPVWRAVINWSDAADGIDAGEAAAVLDDAVKDYAKAYALSLLAAERAEAVRMRTENEKLRKALLPFSRYFCSPPGECLCNNCVARDLLALSPSQQGEPR